MKPVTVIQGPTAYYREILSHYKNQHLIWSTWDNEPHLKEIAAQAELVVNPVPRVEGVGNVNLAMFSTRQGVLKAKESGYDYVLKVRSDILIFDDLTPHLSEQNPSFLCFCDPPYLPRGHLVDYVFGGSVDLMDKLSNFQVGNASIDEYGERLTAEIHLTNRAIELGVTEVKYLLPHISRAWWLSKSIDIALYKTNPHYTLDNL